MSRKRKKHQLLPLVAAIAVFTSVLGGVAVADGHVSVRAEFDESQGQLPEGVAVDKRGNIYVSLAPLGQLMKVPAGTNQPEPFGAIAGINPATDLGLLGLAASPQGDIYAGVQSADPAVNGVWVFDRFTGDAHRIPGSESIGLANDVAFDHRGNLYITDSALGAIWRAPRGGETEPWLTGDPNLAGTGVLGAGAPIGANGVEYHKGTLHVAVTEQFSLVKVPINRDGTPGTSQVVGTFPPGDFPGAPDGLAIDVHGNTYVAMIAQQTIAKVSSSGEVSVVASGDPLDWPSSIAFGTSKGEQKTLFAVNFSIGEGFGDPFPRFGPAIIEVNVGVPGLPLP